VSGPHIRQIAAVATLVMASLAVSHELIYLLAHGTGAEYSRAMQEGGHDRYWSSFVLTVAAVTLVLAVTAVCQIRRLMRQAFLVQAGRLCVDDRGFGLFARLTARLWLTLAAGTSVVFVMQENLETVAAANPLPALGVVSGEHAVALPVIAFVSLMVALVGALVRWGRHVLLSRLNSPRVPVRPRAPRAARAPSLARPASVAAVHSHGLRAPPFSRFSLA
jgi:hypothetical protein